MIVRSPLKTKKVRPNLRKVSPGDHAGKMRDGRSSLRGEGNYGWPVNEKSEKKRKGFPRVKPWKIILGAFLVGVLGVLYLNHVFATQQLLDEVQQLEDEYNQARRINSEYRLMYDRMIGPAAIYEKAKELGFINGGPAEKVIEVERK